MLYLKLNQTNDINIYFNISMVQEIYNSRYLNRIMLYQSIFVAMAKL